MARLKLSLPFSEWPARDQQMWENCREQGAMFEKDGVGAHWALATAENIKSGYGQWLCFLRSRGCLGESSPPCTRVTLLSLTAYIDELALRLSSKSQLSYLVNAKMALQAMDPKGDRTLIARAVRDLRRRARPSRDERNSLAAPSELYFSGLRRMKREWRDATTDRRAAARFEDGLMMAVIVSKSVRRKNHVATQLGRNIVKTAAGVYCLSFDSSETKTGTISKADLPDRLTPFIDYWLHEVRPFLLNGRDSNKFWITSKGTDITGRAFYQRFCNATEEELGRRINPHLVRKIIATGIAVAAPEMIKIAPSLLDHRSDRMVREFYNLADQLTASRKYLKILGVRRKRAIRKHERR